MATTPLRALLIGADSPAAGRLVAVLEEVGGEDFQLHWEERLEDGLERLGEEPFGVLLLALPMPGIELTEALERMRARAKHVAVVALTAADDEELGRAAVRAGALDHVRLDPLDPEVLVRSVLLARAVTDLGETRACLEAIGERPLLEAYRDPLTGLPDKALFLERLGQALARSHAHAGERFAVLALDLDRFQAVNDGLGHAAGDQLLVEVTGRLLRCLRPGDTLTRTGGDLFLMLVDGVRDPDHALHTAEKAQDLLSGPIRLEGEEVFVSAGIGIALGAPHHDRPEDVIRDAYTAMHRAKEHGGSCYELFAPEMQQHSMSRLRLESDLRRALERDELVLHYQPIVSMASGRISGFEALLRWQHPERGLVPPATFIPTAEATGMIVPIGSWVLDHACGTIRTWRAAFGNGEPLSVSVNLSARQFAEPDVVEAVEEALEDHDLEPDALKLEITESVLMEGTRNDQEKLRSLRDLGVGLAIDDFGTGYSSLASLARLPVETLKIDRTFVGRMDYEPENAEIVRTILALGRNLDMSVIAEGVETADQLQELRRLDCRMGQGFFFSNAVDAESASAWLETGPRW